MIPDIRPTKMTKKAIRKIRKMQKKNPVEYEKMCDAWVEKTYRELTHLESRMWEKVVTNVRIFFT